MERLGGRKTGTKKRTTPLTMEEQHGKIPPQAVDLEEAVLGALMLEKDALNAVIDILQPESFYKDAHNRIYASIQRLFQRSEPIDLLTVKNDLQKNGELELVGGAYYLTQLTNRISSAANIEYHSRIISQKYIQRELIRISSDTIRDAYDETTDVFTLLDSAEKNLFQVAEGNIRKNYDSMATLIKQAKEQIKKAGEKGEGVSGVPSGFTELDQLTSGWQPGDLLILAARPGMGKTAFVLSVARNTSVRFGIPTAIFSLEMTALQMVTRLMVTETQLSAEKLKKGNLQSHEWEQLHSKVAKIAEAPLFIDDTPALSIFELRAKARRLKQQHNLGIIIIDYLQLMTAGGEGNGNREQEISFISRSLKSIGKELGVPVIALSQLSRAVETRGGDKRPQLSDLRESGAIEQDADMVMFLYRPEYYKINEDENGNSLLGIGEVIVAKHRNGALKNIPLRFIDSLAKFEDLDSNQFGVITNEGGTSSVIKGSRMNDEWSNDETPF
ncbi:MAG: replicative DNA helicase [Flavobacteriales bacterium]